MLFVYMNGTTLLSSLNRSVKLCIYTDAQGMEQGVAVRECIPVYHKLALSRIQKGEPVVKYGEWIGIAACDIEQGMHVHVHNVWNTKR